MVQPSLRALIADLIGDEPDREARLPAEEVVRGLRVGEVAPARDREGREVAVYRLDDGAAFAVPDACPHDGGPLSTGFIEDGALVCARHGWEFDALTGACQRRAGGLCPRPVPFAGES